MFSSSSLDTALPTLIRETCTHALASLALIPMVINARAHLHRPRRLHLEGLVIPGPSLYQAERTAITVAILARSHLQAATTPGSGENAQGRKRHARRTVFPETHAQVEQTAWSWTGSATCSGRMSTKSGMRNISAAITSSTSCLFHYSVFLLLLLPLSGGAQTKAEINHKPA